jgi:hypothetical protein
MSLSDWLLEKKIERETRDPEERLKFTRISYFLWCIAIVVWGYMFAEDVMGGAERFHIYVTAAFFLSVLSLFIMSFKHAFIRGIAKAWYLPLLYALGLYVCAVMAMFFYTVINFLGFYLDPVSMLEFFFYWFISSVLGIALGAFFRIFRRR